MESKYTELTNKVDGMPLQTNSALQQYSSEILQSAREISLKVSETTTGLKNSIVGSALRPWDDIVKIKASLSQTVNIVNGGGVGGSNYATFSASGATANTYTGLYFNDVRVVPGKKYTFSILVKVIRATDNGSYYSIKRFDNGVESTVIKASNYSTAVSDWVLYTSQITVPSGCSRLLIETAVRKNGTINVCRPMLMEGTEYSGWSLSPNDKTEAGKLGSDLISTGIDIEKGKITVTADKFEIRNNSGEVTASVNENGQLDVNEGLFKGFVCKKLTRITSANLHKYILNQYVGEGHISFDFTKTGSFIEIVDGSSFGATPVIVLPFYSSDKKHTFAALSAKDVRDVLPYYGQDIIIINRSGKAFDMIGGYLQDNTSGSPQNVIYNNTAVILTCGCSGTISKVEAQWVGRKLSGFNGVYDVLAGGKAADEATDGETTTLSSEDEPTEVNDLKT